MRLILPALLAVLGQPALAHPGHLIEVAGHGHWIGAAAIGLAIALGVREALKSRAKPAAKDGKDAENTKAPAGERA